MSKPHDAHYKELFSYPEFVQQLIEGFAPPEISNLLDYTTLKIHTGNYITPLLDEKVEDVVWSVALKPSASEESSFSDSSQSPATAQIPPVSKPQKDQPPITIYIYILLEFQRKVDRTMPLRMLHYVASFYHQLLKNKVIKLKQGLPPVFPIVLYNGETEWKVSTQMQSLIQPVPDFLTRFQPQLHYWLVDEKRLPPQYLHHTNSPLSYLFAIEQADSRSTMLNTLSHLLQSVKTHPDYERLGQAIQHFIQWQLQNKQLPITLEEGLTNDLEDYMSKLAKNWEKEAQEIRQEGWQDGRQEGVELGLQKGVEVGRQEGVEVGQRRQLQRLLALKFGTLSADITARVENANSDQLGQWADRILFANTLDEVFNPSLR